MLKVRLSVVVQVLSLRENGQVILTMLKVRKVVKAYLLLQ